MTIAKGRSNPKRASFRRLNLVGTVLTLACSGNDGGLLQPSVPPPAIDAIFPSAALAGSSDLTLTITGKHFVDGGPDGSYAAWVAGGDTTLLETVYVSSTQLSAVIPAALLSKPVSAQVLLKTGDVMGDLPLFSSNAVGFTVTDATDLSTTGRIIVYAQISTLPPGLKGSREVSLDGSPWSLLTEGQSLIYSPVSPGGHGLLLSEPCTSTHVPAKTKLTVSMGQTVTVTVDIPANCE